MISATTAFTDCILYFVVSTYLQLVIYSNLLDVVLCEVLEHEVHVEVLLHRGLVQLHPALSRHALNLKPVESYFAMTNRPSSELSMIFAEGDLVPSTNNSVFSTLSELL